MSKFEKREDTSIDRDELQFSKEKWHRFVNGEKRNTISNNEVVKGDFKENVKL